MNDRQTSGSCAAPAGAVVGASSVSDRGWSWTETRSDANIKGGYRWNAVAVRTVFVGQAALRCGPNPPPKVTRTDKNCTAENRLTKLGGFGKFVVGWLVDGAKKEGVMKGPWRSPNSTFIGLSVTAQEGLAFTPSGRGLSRRPNSLCDCARGRCAVSACVYAWAQKTGILLPKRLQGTSARLKCECRSGVRAGYGTARRGKEVMTVMWEAEHEP